MQIDREPQTTKAPRTSDIAGQRIVTGKAALQMAEHTEGWNRIDPLNDADYDRVFYGAFVPNSTEYWRADGSEGPMLFRTRSILRSLPRFSSMLSVGAGDGMFDSDLYGDESLESFCAIEPNDKHLGKLREKVDQKSNWGNRLVVENHFDENFDPDQVEKRKFDAVLMTHCAYFLKKPSCSNKTRSVHDESTWSCSCTASRP
ncbi:TPA: hypothetical protein DE059_03790 [Candidatus Peribacteria bacterium]|nr:hypothetical protein [Candidatus Peribacteria bacterium]|tara:strand:+ start:562 stop:1167 length:606 start_codon:yes stop_codon:yes gene_type:complete